MYPRLLELGPITVYTYGVLLAAAYLFGLQLARVRARKRGLDANRILDLGIYIIISALVGAKLLLLITDFKAFSADPRELLTLARSGGVFYGGLIVAVIVALWYIRRIGLPLWTTCDVFAPGIALGHVVGRLGCFFAGCCYGKPTTVPWAITFTDPFAAANVGTPLNMPLHPTQLYEAGAELLILIVLLTTEKKGRPFPGRTFWLYMLLYAISRFSIEIPEPVDAAPQPEALPLPILYQDQDLIVVDKPAGMVVHPAAGHASGTLVNALLHHVDDLSGIGGEKRPGIVHRLDRGTSGLMVVAKNDAAHDALTRQFHDREVEKEYIALVWGGVQAGRRIDAPIGRDPANRKKMSARARRR